jgi:hypothetical protein
MCQQRGLFRTIVWGMPDPEHFDFVKYAVGGCCPPSASPPDCRCSGYGFDGYRDAISGQSLGYKYLWQRWNIAGLFEQGITNNS